MVQHAEGEERVDAGVVLPQPRAQPAGVAVAGHAQRGPGLVSQLGLGGGDLVEGSVQFVGGTGAGVGRGHPTVTRLRILNWRYHAYSPIRRPSASSRMTVAWWSWTSSFDARGGTLPSVRLVFLVG